MLAAPSCTGLSRPRVLAIKKTVHASEQNRPDVALKRWLWRRAIPTLDPDDLVFLDETWFRTDMTPLRGWATKGERLMAKVPAVTGKPQRWLPD